MGSEGALPILRDLMAREAVVFVGMGNILLGDDGIGPEMAALLAEHGYVTVDAGTVPENHIGAVARLQPSTVVLIDAVHLGREPGAVELLGREEILSGVGFSTHSLSPVLVMERLEQETGAEVVMLAIQPGSLEFGTPLTQPLADLLRDVGKFVKLMAD